MSVKCNFDNNNCTTAFISQHYLINQVPSCPHVCGTSSPEGFCLVASSQVILFNASCSDVHATLNFGELQMLHHVIIGN